MSTTESQCPVLATGVYSPSTKTDLRSPCPLLNCLANHGYLPRDGRNIDSDILYKSLRKVSISPLLASVLVNPTYIASEDRGKPTGFWARLWRILCYPFAALDGNALWKRGDFHNGKKVVTLDQLARHGFIEHDVSLSRNDWKKGEGDNNSRDFKLIEEMLEHAGGGDTLTASQLAAYRRLRIENKDRDAVYGLHEHQFSCGNIAMILKVLGDGKSVPCEYVRAFFVDERLPEDEGWAPRRWTVGLFEIMWTASWIKKLIGIKKVDIVAVA